MSNNSSTCASVAAPVNESSQGDRLAALTQRVTRFVSRDMIATVVTSFVLFGMMTLQGIFLARMLGPEGRGQYATAVFYTQTLTYIGLLGTQHSVARWAARRKSDVGRLWRCVLQVGSLTGFLTMLAVAALAFLALPAEKSMLAPLCILCSLFLPFEHVRLLGLSVDQGDHNFRHYNACRLVAGMAFPVLLALAWLSGSGSPGVASLLFALAPIVGLVFQRMTLPTEIGTVNTDRGPTVSKIIQKGRPYALAVLVSDLCDRLDIFLFLWLTSFTAQGYYAAAVPAANLLLIVPIALQAFAFNRGARRVQQSAPASLCKMAALIFGIQVVATVSFAVVLEPLMVFVFGEPFREAVPLTLALLPAYAVSGCGRIAEAYLQGRNKAIVGVYARVAGAVTMCVFIYLTFAKRQELSIPFGSLAGHIVSVAIVFSLILVDARRSAFNETFREEPTP